MDFLSQEDKDVFKTAFELDQRWLIELAADRAPMICQSQALNVFLPADLHKRDLHRIHFQAWKKGVKSLYYCRSKSIQRAESTLSQQVARTEPQAIRHLGKVKCGEDRAVRRNRSAKPEYDECLACQ